MRTSEQINELAGALALAQADIEGASKDATNPAFGGRKYADLSAVWRACRGPLTAHGLSVVQMPGFADGRISVETVLLHKSGQWIAGEVSVPLEKEPGRNASQSIGSAVTYLRRYALSAVASVCPEDDDGESSGAKVGQRQTRRADSDGVLMASHKQRSLIASRAREKGIDAEVLKRMAEAVCGDVSQGIPADKVDAMLLEISQWVPETVEKAVASEPAPASPFGNMAEQVPEVMGADDLQTARARVLALLDDEEIPQDVRDTYRGLLKKHTEKGSPAGEFHSLAQLLEGSKKVARKKAREKQERLAETLTS